MIEQLFHDFIVPFEGLHKVKADGLVYPYICPAGYPTQGYGVLVKDLSAPPITREEAEQRCLALLPAYVEDAYRIVPRLWLLPNEVGIAIADFTYNLGASRLRSSTLRVKLMDGDLEGACAELPKWRLGGGRVLQGLVLRRAKEVELIRSVM